MKKNRYILLLAAFLTAMFAFEYYYLEPRSDSMQESIETQYGVLKRYEYFIEIAGITAADIKESIMETRNIEKRLIREKSESLAAGTMQEVVTGIIKYAGLNVLIVRPLSPVRINKYSRIPIYFEGNGDIQQISDFLKKIESNNLLIKIDKLDLNVKNVQNPRDVRFKIQLSGLMKT